MPSPTRGPVPSKENYSLPTTIETAGCNGQDSKIESIFAWLNALPAANPNPGIGRCNH